MSIAWVVFCCIVVGYIAYKAGVEKSKASARNLCERMDMLNADLRKEIEQLRLKVEIPEERAIRENTERERQAVSLKAAQDHLKRREIFSINPGSGGKPT